MAKIFISFNVVTTSDVILVVREVAAPLAEVFRQFYPAPHTQQNLTVTPVNPVMHMVQIWTTTDGVTLGLLLGQCDIDASLSAQNAFTAIQFVVDRGVTGAPSYDPVSNQAQYVNPDLAGLGRADYTVFKGGFGALTWGIEIDILGTGDGFEYIDGEDFSAGEEYTVLVNKLVQVQTLSSGAGYPEDVVAVTASRAVVAGDMNKLLEVNASTNITLTLDITGIANGKVFGINTHNGTQKYVGLQLAGGQYVMVNGVQKNLIWLGRGETVTLIKKAGYLRVVNDWDGYRLLGSRVKADFATKPWNGLLAIGGWVLKTDYPRVWEYVQTLGGEAINLPDDTVITALDLAIWHYGDSKIWIPDYGGYFERNYDPNQDVDTDNGNRLPGRIQDDMFESHSHIENGSNDGGSAHGFVMDNNNTGGTGAGTPVSTNTTGGSETRGKNISAYTYIIG